MGDHRGDERVPHGEAFDREAAEDLTALPEDELRARLERAWRDLQCLRRRGGR